MSKNPTPTATKQRLLDAATDVFAEHGFENAGVREICRRAKANAAAVNYHFGGKERLYAEVLVSSHGRAMGKRRMPVLGDDPEHPERVLGAWVRWHLETLLREAPSGPLGKLMAREMFQPSPVFGELIRRSIAPMFRAVREVVGALLGDGATSDDIYLGTHSTIGQILLYRHAQPAFEQIQALVDDGVLPGPGPLHASRDLDALARHITEFSLAGLHAMRARGESTGGLS